MTAFMALLLIGIVAIGIDLIVFAIVYFIARGVTTIIAYLDTDRIEGDF